METFSLESGTPGWNHKCLNKLGEKKKKNQMTDLVN